MTLRIRFVAGGTKGAATTTEQATRSLAATIANDLAFQAADNAFRRVRTEVGNAFQRDAKQELTHLAALYRRHIIGASPGARRPSGMLGYALQPSDTGVGDDDREIAIAESLPDWAPRNPAYLRRKKRMGWSQSWFSARGDLNKGMRADNLLAAYGPIRVSVIRNVESTAKAQPNVQIVNNRKVVTGGFSGARLETFGSNANPAKSKSAADVAASHIRLQVATVRIYAMQNITPSMLPALANGDPTAMNDDDPARGRRFLQPFKDSGQPDLYYRLSRTSWKTGRYRPTLEPFLAWYLTRALPNALALRIEQGAIRRARRTNVVRGQTSR